MKYFVITIFGSILFLQLGLIALWLEHHHYINLGLIPFR